MNLNFAASLLDENFLVEPVWDTSRVQAIAWVKNYYKRGAKDYGVSAGHESNRGGTTHDVSKAEELIEIIETEFVHPVDWDHRQKWTKTFILGLTRILVEELKYGTPAENKMKVEAMKKMYLTACMKLYNDQNFLGKDPNMKGMSFNQLRTLLRPDAAAMKAQWQELYDHRPAEAAEEDEAEATARPSAAAAEEIDTQTEGPYAGCEPPYQDGAFKLGNYNAVRIDTFEQSHSWWIYTNSADGCKTLSDWERGNYRAGCHWCITEGEGHFRSYSLHQSNTAYYCWKDNFNQLNQYDFGDGTPTDEWGKSLVCMIIESDGEIRSLTCRYNHCNNRNNWGDESNGWGDGFGNVLEGDSLIEKAANLFGCTENDIREKCKSRSSGAINHTNIERKIKQYQDEGKKLTDCDDIDYDYTDLLSYWFLKDNNEYTLMCGNERLTPFWFKRNSTSFEYGLMKIDFGSKSNYIDTTGEVVLPVNFDDDYCLFNTFYRIIQFGNKYNILNMKSKRLLFRNAVDYPPRSQASYGKYIPCVHTLGSDRAVGLYNRYGQLMPIGTENNNNVTCFENGAGDFVVGKDRRSGQYLYKMPRMTVVCKLNSSNLFMSFDNKYFTVKVDRLNVENNPDQYSDAWCVFDINGNLVEGVTSTRPVKFSDNCSEQLFICETGSNITVYNEDGDAIKVLENADLRSVRIHNNMLNYNSKYSLFRNGTFEPEFSIDKYGNQMNDSSYAFNGSIFEKELPRHKICTFMDSNGKITYRFKGYYSSVYGPDNKYYFYIIKDAKYGLINPDAKLVLNPIYAEPPTHIGEGMWLVKKRSGYNIVSENEDYEEILTKDFDKLLTPFSANGIAVSYTHLRAHET